MEWTPLHGPLLAQTLDRVLGIPQPGAMAFVRCLTPDVIKALGAEPSFAPSGWRVLRVADETQTEQRTITADEAVELRESKGDALLLLIDTERAGAGMDGIYSASREVDEGTLFREAQRLAGDAITQRHCAADRRYAERAIRRARGHGGSYGVSRWTEFDFLCRVATGDRPPGAYLHLLGLWPVPSVTIDTKGFALLRTPVEEGRRKSFRVFRPSLIAEVEKQWIDCQGAIGRWTVKVRGTGHRAGAAVFEPFEERGGDAWKRARSTSRRMGERFQAGGGVSQPRRR